MNRLTNMIICNHSTLQEDFEAYYRMMFWRFQQFVKYTFYHHAEFEMPKEKSDMWDVVFDIRRNDRQVRYSENSYV